MTCLIADCGLRNADCQRRPVWRAAQLKANSQQLTANSHSGFTLIELLITITIIAILAALVLGAASVAGETAREAKTKQLVSRIHTLLMEHYDSFRNRRVEMAPAVLNAISSNYSASNPRLIGPATAEARLYGMRELLLMELPDRWSDITLEVIPSNPEPYVEPTRPPIKPFYLASRPAMANVFLRRYNTITDNNYKNTLTGVPNTGEELVANQSAECLYLIVTLACGDGEARSLFHQGDYGDTDGDGAPEFLDGWGKPIAFLRWAPGYRSFAQLNTVDLATFSAADQLKFITKNRDPFDMFRADPDAFRLLPLVYSAGRDEAFGMDDQPNYVPWLVTGGMTFNTDKPYIDRPQLDPYAPYVTSPNSFYIGQNTYNNGPPKKGQTIEESLDNYTNHLIEYEKRK